MRRRRKKLSQKKILKRRLINKSSGLKFVQLSSNKSLPTKVYKKKIIKTILKRRKLINNSRKNEEKPLNKTINSNEIINAENNKSKKALLKK